jgi:uncharacterized repeat protein (TIGR03803 family)
MKTALNTLVDFKGTNGSLPAFSSLIADTHGNLFGTTSAGGASNLGTVFEIAKGSGHITTLVSFHGTDGATPDGGLIIDANGNLFGTTLNGGASNDGTVFGIAKTDAGYASNPTTLASFSGFDGHGPIGSLIMDANGDLFGATYTGGASNDGTVFEIAKTALGYDSTPITVVTFNGANGAQPLGSLIMDANGDLFGTTQNGGLSTDGTVFELVKSGSSYTLNTLVTFDGFDGGHPLGGLIFDANGDLLGTTELGGATNQGTVFGILKSGSGFASTATTLAQFNGTDGLGPEGSLTIDANGNLFGTTFTGGASNDGTVFEVLNTPFGYDPTPTTLVSFSGTDGQQPESGVIADTHGNLFGTTALGGASNLGTVFQINGAGFFV